MTSSGGCRTVPSARRLSAPSAPPAADIRQLELRIQPRFGNGPIAKIDHESIQRWVNEMSTSGVSPRTVRWTHTGLNVEDVDLVARRIRVRRSITQVGGKLVEGNPKSDAGRRSVPIPECLVPGLKARLDNRPPAAPAIASPRGSRLGLENWKRAVNWKAATAKVGREKMRVHDLGPYVCLAKRRAGADLRLLQKATGHASISVTAHTYADLFDDELTGDFRTSDYVAAI